MVERIEDLNLPNAVVTRLMKVRSVDFLYFILNHDNLFYFHDKFTFIKDALPDGVSISKEARSALTRAASVFILYLTTSASSAAKDKKVKTMTANHIFEALEEIEFENFVEPLKKFLEGKLCSTQ